MRKLILLSILLLCGCEGITLFRSRPMPNQANIKEEMTTTKKTNVEAEVLIETKPPPLSDGPELEYDFMGEKMTVPSSSNVTVKLNTKARASETDWYSIAGTLNPKSGMGQIIFIGILCVAGGVVLCYFGMWTIGIGVAIFGVMLIACGITIEKYPWVFLIVMILGLVGVGIFIYYTIKNKKLTIAGKDMQTVLTEVCDKIETLKDISPDLVKEHITDKLLKSDNSAVIKEITRKVRAKKG